MRFLDGGCCRLFSRPALLAILLLCGGCHTAGKRLFTVGGPGWEIQEGQALWRPRKGIPELAGDIIVAHHPQGLALVEFAKTPMVLASAQTTRTNWLIQFPPKNWSFRGRGKPSPRFALLHLQRALAGEPLPPGYSFQRKPDGGWRLENTRSGESVDGFLGR